MCVMCIITPYHIHLYPLVATSDAFNGKLSPTLFSIITRYKKNVPAFECTRVSSENLQKIMLIGTTVKVNRTILLLSTDY